MTRKHAKQKSEDPGGPGRPGQVATVSFRLVFRQRGPLDPAKISKTLRLKPDVTWKMGEDQIAANGQLTGRTNYDSTWGLSISFYDEKPANDDYEYRQPELGKRLLRFLKPLRKNRAFVRRLSRECWMAFVSIECPGQLHYGTELKPKVLKAVADLGLVLGFEVCPDSAS